MLRFKQFTGRADELETAVNRWLEEYEPDVNQMTQTVTQDGQVVLCIVFEESFRGQERRLSDKHGMGRASAPAVPPSVAPDRPLHVQEPEGPTS